MAGKKPYYFTAISYIENRSGDGSVRCQEKLTFRQDRLPDGTFHSTLLKREIIMPEEEQNKCCEKMMEHVSENLSNYLSSSSDPPYREIS